MEEGVGVLLKQLDRRESIERLARAMCQEAGAEPDIMVYRGPPVVTARDGYLVAPRDFQLLPMWSLWARDAEVALRLTDVQIRSGFDK